MESNINKLAEALSKAQAEIKAAQQDGMNPHFKSRYATLESCMDAIREPFAKHGLSITQPTEILEGQLVLRTILLHTSGQQISGVYPIIVDRQTPQAYGSAMTYARRYALCAITGLTSGDDDGEAAEGRTEEVKTLKLSPAKPLNKITRQTKFNVNVGKGRERFLGLSFDEMEAKGIGTAFCQAIVSFKDWCVKEKKELKGPMLEWFNFVSEVLSETQPVDTPTPETFLSGPTQRVQAKPISQIEPREEDIPF